MITLHERFTFTKTGWKIVIDKHSLTRSQINLADFKVKCSWRIHIDKPYHKPGWPSDQISFLDFIRLSQRESLPWDEKCLIKAARNQNFYSELQLDENLQDIVVFMFTRKNFHQIQSPK